MPVDCPLNASKLEEIAENYGTPYQLYDEGLIRENAQKLISTFKTRFPNFKEFFAVKALPNPAILKILESEGCGFDCSSTSELDLCKMLGVDGKDVMFTSNYTSKKDLKQAVDQGVVLNLDDKSLIDTTVEVYGGSLPQTMCFRLNPGIGAGRTDSETISNVLGGPSAKFGVPDNQIVDSYKLAKANGATKFGIHMMTGSCVLNDDYWIEMVAKMLDTIALIRKEVQIEFDFVNIGGGLGIPYKHNTPSVDIAGLVDKIGDVFDQKLQEHNMPRPHLYMENGRYMTGPYGWLVSRCQAVKHSWETYYGLDACMANLMRPGMYGSYHHISIPTADNQSNLHSCNVVGTLCENNDWFAKQRELPVAQTGDLFVIHDTGAHAHSMGFQYNGKLRAPEILLRSNGGVNLIRKRETFNDLIHNTVMPSDLPTRSSNQNLEQSTTTSTSNGNHKGGTIKAPRNPNFSKLVAGYLFPTIGKLRREYIANNPNKKVISLGVGDTTEPLPTTVSSAMSKYATALGTKEGYSGYDPVIMEPLKEHIASVLYKDIIKTNEIFISDGSKPDIGRLGLLIGFDAKIAVQDPAYPVYVDSSVMYGRSSHINQETNQYDNIVYLPCSPDNSFFPSLEKASDADVIFFCNPNNPTGAAATRIQLTALVDFARKNKQLIIYDSAYASFISDPEKPKSIFEIPGAREVALETSSFSKLAGFTGVRCGWTVVPNELTFPDGTPVNKDWGRIMGTVFNGAANISIAGALAALENIDETMKIVHHYKENAKIISETVKTIGLKSYGGTDAPYVFVKFPGKTSWAAFTEILHKAQVVTTPGSGFGPSGEGFIRISAFGNRDNVIEACNRLKSVFGDAK